MTELRNRVSMIEGLHNPRVLMAAVILTRAEQTELAELTRTEQAETNDHTHTPENMLRRLRQRKAAREARATAPPRMRMVEVTEREYSELMRQRTRGGNTC